MAGSAPPKWQAMMRAAERNFATRSRTVWTIVGLLAGAFVGVYLGGIGISARGGAVGASAIEVVGILALVGAYCGYRFGTSRARQGR